MFSHRLVERVSLEGQEGADLLNHPCEGNAGNFFLSVSTLP